MGTNGSRMVKVKIKTSDGILLEIVMKSRG